MKIISFYLPQFHCIPENDEWWGKGFTEWTNTKKSKPLFLNHYQPHIPYNEDYYDLEDVNVMKRQIKDAKEYGVYGFCFYHYWFKKGKMLLQKPIENFLHNRDLDIHFCISWANEPWSRRWDGGDHQILMPQEYGDEKEWTDHFYYLLDYFKDSRYIRVDGKPLILIYRPEIIYCLDSMIEKWQQLARKNGFEGLTIMAQGSMYCRHMSTRKKNNSIDAYLMYEPGYTYNAFSLKDKTNFIINTICYHKLFWHYFPRKVISRIKQNILKNSKVPSDLCDYDIMWESILLNKVPENYYPGAFTAWDNSPRRGAQARIITGSDPVKFEKYMKQIIIKGRSEFKKDLLFINAWNEWAEGAHLEADERYGYAYLNALKNALIDTSEWEEIE